MSGPQCVNACYSCPLSGVRVLSNAGGVNPAACVQALREAAEKAGVDLNIAMVTGDDLIPVVSL